MELTVYVEQNGEVLDEMKVTCDIVDNENAVATIGDVPDELSFRAVSLPAVIDEVSHELWTKPIMNPESQEGGGEDIRFDLTCSGLSDFSDIVFHFEYAVQGSEPLELEESMIVDSADNAHYTFEGSTPDDAVITAKAVYGRVDGEEEELYLLWSA